MKGSFYSTSDCDGNAMIFCDIQWPQKKFDEKFATLTEEKLQA